MQKMNGLILSLGFCLVPTLGVAQQSPDRESLRSYCTGDYLEHCSAFAPGGSEVETCFQTNFKKLSPGCSAAILAYKQDQRPVRRVSATR